MSDDELMALIISVDPQAVRIPPGIKAIADRIEDASRRAALEEARQAAEFVASRYSRHTPHPAEHPHVQGVREGTLESLDAIRALANGDKNG